MKVRVLPGAPEKQEFGIDERHASGPCLGGEPRQIAWLPEAVRGGRPRAFRRWQGHCRGIQRELRQSCAGGQFLHQCGGRGQRRRHPPGGPFRAGRLSRMAGLFGRGATGPSAPHRGRHRNQGGGNRPDRILGYGPAHPLHEQGRRARRGELPLLCRPGAGSPQRTLAAGGATPELHAAPAHRPGGRHHPLEHALHALHLEDRPGSGRWLHGGSQAGGMEPADGPPARGNLLRSRAAFPGRSTPCRASARRPARR